MIHDPLFYGVAVVAVLITAISKGGFGGGLGVMAVPLMSLVIDPIRAAAILLPILCLMDIFGVWAYRRTWDGANLRILIPAAVVGIAVGTALVRLIDEDFIRVLVGLIAVLFSLDYWIRRGRVSGNVQRLSRAKGGLWGGLAGFTSFLAHAGGPPVSVFLLPQRMDKSVLVGTTAIFFISVNYLKLIPYAYLGQLSAANLRESLVLAPLAPIGIGLGVWLHNRVSEKLFYQVSYVLVFLTGAKLLWDVFAH